MDQIRNNQTLKIIECAELFNGITAAEASRLTGVSVTSCDIVIRFLKIASQQDVDLLKNGKITYRSMIRRLPRMKAGSHLKAPNGVASLVDFVDKHLVDENVSVNELASLTGMHDDSVGKIRSLILLRRRKDLSQEDASKINEALRIIDVTRRITPAMRVVNGVMSRLWKPRTLSGQLREVERRSKRKETKAKRRLDNTLFQIREACTNNEEMVMPFLSDDERKEALDIILESQRALWELFDKVRKEQDISHDDEHQKT